MENPPPQATQQSIEELIRQVRDLQNRVLSLEQRLGGVPAQPAVFPEEVPSLPDAASALPVVGRALLGIAGAYLLRALTEFGTLPHGVGVTLGVLYAALWLVFAARAPAERTLVVTMHCLTSVCVLAPLLWEATLRFGVLSTRSTAAVLVLFSLFGLAISWRKNLSIIAWATTLAGMGTAAALLVGTRDVVPFTLALLAIAAAIEFSACCDHWVGERWIAALLVDLSVLLLTYLVVRRGGVPDGYAPLRPAAVVAIQIALLIVYLASTAVRTLFRGLSFTAFEVLQTVAAFLLCLGGALRIAQGGRTAFWVTGAATLLSGAFCYAVSFALLERREGSQRSFYTYSTYALLLVLTGSTILLSGAALAAAWSLLALLCLWLGGRFGRSTVRLHGALYLLLLSVVSGVFSEAVSNLLGAMSGWGHPDLAGLVSAGAVLLCYPLVVHTARPDKVHWVERLSVLLVAVNLAWTMALLLAALPYIAWGAFEGPGKASLIATSQTGLLTLLSVALAWTGRRCQRPELVWLVFPLMLLTGYRILVHDFRLEHTLALFLSLLLYGGALVLLPRILAKDKTVSA